MRTATLFLWLALFLTTPSSAQEIIAQVQTDTQEWEWVGADPYLITVIPKEQIQIGFWAEPEMTPRQEIYFHLQVAGSVSLDSFSVPPEFNHEGEYVPDERGWTQEVHLSDLGGCLDPSESFGTLKALYD